MLEQMTTRFFGMSDEVWLPHANPLSGWTRYKDKSPEYGKRLY